MEIKNEYKLVVRREEFVSANILECIAGTNTPQGGDAGHGGKTIFSLRDLASTGWKVKVRDRNGKEFEIEPDQVTIELYGDTEGETFLKALKFAVETIELQMETTEKNRELSFEARLSK